MPRTGRDVDVSACALIWTSRLVPSLVTSVRHARCRDRLDDEEHGRETGTHLCGHQWEWLCAPSMKYDLKSYAGREGRRVYVRRVRATPHGASLHAARLGTRHALGPQSRVSADPVSRIAVNFVKHFTGLPVFFIKSRQIYLRAVRGVRGEGFFAAILFTRVRPSATRRRRAGLQASCSQE